MTAVNEGVTILSDLQIDVCPGDLAGLLKTSGRSSGLFQTVRKVLERARGAWRPAGLFRWFTFEPGRDSTGRIRKNSGETVEFDFGHSAVFLEPARQVMVLSYTIGDILDRKRARFSSENRLLDAYVADLIGLAALEKTGAVLKRAAEDRARRMGWGVSPFLSPGSVHGWALEDQTALCRLLPVEKIRVTVQHTGALYPLKSMAALIGIGPGYTSETVGIPCAVCSRRETCRMRNRWNDS